MSDTKPGGMAEQAAEKFYLPRKGAPGLKPALIADVLRGSFDKLRTGSKGPLFHGGAYIREFFRSL
jgi:hypothetical protein